MNKSCFLFFAFAAIAAAKSLNKRSNGYGDEAVNPAPLLSQSYKSVGVIEQGPAQVPQPPPEVSASVQASGYRRKRGTQNGYGDELVAPAAPSFPDQSYSAPVEQTPTGLVQHAPPSTHVQSSGYRKKRSAQNGYGDELVTPFAPAYGEEAYGPAPVEQAPAPVAEQAPIAPAPVQASGYRKKRGAQNGYGDEVVTPVAPAYGEQAYNEPPVEQAPAVVAQPAAGSSPVTIQASGYRKKRGTQNGYGDELVAPIAPAPQEQSYGVQAVVEQGSAPIAQTAAVPAAVQASGYRKKRGTYADEPITPSAGGYGEQEKIASPLEQGPSQVAQPAPSAPTPVQASGY
uniref:Translation initiation factor IF-2 n=1 Tax=Steinernema glaseri TaxID=37863 RepID=A0A1I7YLQ6_9BILA